jgi:hypothetical protein
MRKLIVLGLSLIALSSSQTVFAQTDVSDLDKMMEEDSKPKKEFAKNAFKSSRVVNGHSMEMLGKGVLDFRILHRFGMIKDGYREFFGLDQASMRMGFDYGITKNLTIGYGRSTFQKELDGFVKYRILHQHTGEKAVPFSLLWISGMTMTTAKISDSKLNTFSNRLGYYHQVIIGRKFSESFTLQLSPTMVHRNLVDLKTDKNDMIAVGVGTRYKISKRSAILLDAFPILYGAREDYNTFPLSIGFDIETGGHVFQLHVSNSRGMNEKAFISETTQDWGKGQINLGFNLSRVFTVVSNKEGSW